MFLRLLLKDSLRERLHETSDRDRSLYTEFGSGPPPMQHKA